MKRTLRKVFSLLLALSMVMSLLSVTAMAEGGDAGVKTSAEQIVLGGGTKYYKADGTEVTNGTAVGSDDVAVALSKTIEGNPLENIFDITLKVETNLKQEENYYVTTAPDAAVLLTFDLSGTMGREEISSGQTRIDAARTEAQAFITRYKASAAGTDAKRMLAIVGFDTDAYVIMDWIDVNNAANADTAINDAFRTYSECTGPGTHSGDRVDAKPCECASGWTGNTLYWGRHSCTNFDGGMILSRNMLKENDLAGIAKTNTWNFILSDGAPTVTSDDTDSVETIVSEAFWASPGGGHGNKTVDAEIENSQGYLEEIADKANVFMIGVGVGDKPFGDCSSVSDDTTTGEWLKSLVDADEVDGIYEDVTDSAGLTKAFNDLFDLIKATADKETITSSAWTTVDPIDANASTPYVEFVGFFSEDPTKDGLYDSLTKSPDGDTASQKTDSNNQYDANGGIYIDWDLKESVAQVNNGISTYSIKYRVRLANEDENFSERDVLKTNGKTTFSWQFVTDNVFGDPITKEFPVPQIKGYLGEFDFQKLDQAGNPLPGAQFELAHKSGCTLCSGVVFDALTAVSDDTGKVSFSNIPSGHEYVLTETDAPAGYYTDPAHTWPVEVSFNTRTVNGDAGLPSVTNLPLGKLTVTKDVTGARTENDFTAGAFSVTVTGPDNYNQTIQLPVQDGDALKWSVTLDDLQPGEYTVAENTQAIPGVGSGYAWNGVTYSAEGGKVAVVNNATASVTVKNDYSYNPANVNVTVEKKWDDANNCDGLRPVSVRVGIFSGETNVGSPAYIDIPVVDGAPVTFSYDSNKYASVTAKEIGYTDESGYHAGIVPGYTVNDEKATGSADAALELTNVHERESVVINFVKEWAESTLSKKPESIVVILKADGREVNRTTVRPEIEQLPGELEGDEPVVIEHWGCTFEADAQGNPLYKNNEDGTPVEYIVEEVINGQKVPMSSGIGWYGVYSASQWQAVNTPDSQADWAKDITITNNYGTSSAPSSTSLTVRKVWSGDTGLNVRPESITVELLKDGVATGQTKTLSAKNGWNAYWGGLDLGHTWSADEVDVPAGYTVSISKSGTAVTITNTYEEVELPDENPPLEELPDEDIPLADVPKTGDASLLWLASTAISGMGLIGLSAPKFRKGRREEE